jgi:hypothetical protein
MARNLVRTSQGTRCVCITAPDVSGRVGQGKSERWLGAQVGNGLVLLRSIFPGPTPAWVS